MLKSLTEIKQEQSRLIEEATECTGISEDDAFLLLRHHGWDVAAFNEAFFDDCEGVLARAGVPLCLEAGGSSPSRAALKNESLCGICFCDPGVSVLPCEQRPMKKDGKPCDHPRYCMDCWLQYVQHAVSEGKACVDLRCPTPGCGEAMRPSHFAKILGSSQNTELLERYRRFSAESLVDDSRGRLRWCPGQNCGAAAPRPLSASTEICCHCGTQWCFHCLTDSHLPVTCESVKKWQEKNKSDEGFFGNNSTGSRRKYQRDAARATMQHPGHGSSVHE